MAEAPLSTFSACHPLKVAVELKRCDGIRMSKLVRTAAAILLGATDACLVAVAERCEVQEIATFDRRHFPAITPKSGGHFTLLPATLSS